MRTKTTPFVVIGAIAFSAWFAGARQVSTITTTLIEYGYTVVPLKRAQNAVYASCKANGQSLSLVVDTGAQATVIHAGKLSSVGGQFKKKEGHAYGVAGVTKGTLKVGEIDAFEVGSYKAGSHPVGAMDFSYQPRPALGTSMDGLLGIDFLHRHQAVIDCFQMNLFLKSPTAPSSSAALSAGLKAGGCTEIPLHIAPTGLAVSTTIDGRSGYLIVDTGSPFTLFREHAIAELGMRRTSISARSRLQMIDVGKNTAQVQMVYFKTMDIGGFNVPSQGVGVADVPMLKGGGPGGVFFGYLGQDLLAYYVAIIDCHALKLYLRLDPAIEAERKKRNG